MLTHRTALALCFLAVALYALAVAWMTLGAPCVWDGSLVATLNARF